MLLKLIEKDLIRKKIWKETTDSVQQKDFEENKREICKIISRRELIRRTQISWQKKLRICQTCKIASSTHPPPQILCINRIYLEQQIQVVVQEFQQQR